MKKRFLVPVALIVILLVILLGSGTFRTSTSPGRTVEVARGSIEVWTTYDGVLESRLLRTVAARTRGSMTIMELVPEGATVEEGDLLVRFDSSDLERDLVRLERDHALAKAELESLLNAKLPLEVRDLEVRLLEARTQFDAEQQYLDDSRDLLAEDLISEQEVLQQETKVEAARVKAESLELQLNLTTNYLHPSAVEQAEARLASAEQEFGMAQENLANCVVTAAVAGMVVYKPVHVGGEFRTARVGDTIYRNQPFLALPDMSDPIVRCSVPESELSRVSAGSRVTIVPLAYPDLKLEGVVESVGSMAQSVQGRPQWQRYFNVVVRLSAQEARLRDGMSVRASVLSHHADNALLVPRTAVQWDGDVSYCEVLRFGRRVRREVRLGLGNDRDYEVLDGVEEGERVVAR